MVINACLIVHTGRAESKMSPSSVRWIMHIVGFGHCEVNTECIDGMVLPSAEAVNRVTGPSGLTQTLPCTLPNITSVYIHVCMYESTLLVGRYVRFSLVPNSQRVANCYTETSTTLNYRTKTGKMRTASYIFEAEDELRMTFEFLYLFI